MISNIKASSPGNSFFKTAGFKSIKPSSIGKLGLYLLLIFSSGIMLIPFFWMLSASLKTEVQVFEYPIRWIPENPQWMNYVEIWKKIDFLVYYLNTVKLSIIIVLVQLLTSSMAGYAFAKVEFPERNTLFLGYLATMMVPFQVLMIPQYIIFSKLNLVDSHWSLILAGAFSPFGVFLMRQFYLNIPNELSEAARIDGMNEFNIYTKIILPLSKPALASLTIFTFVATWNDFLAPLIYLNSTAKKTIQLGIRQFLTQYSAEYHLIMAASVCSVIPVLILFMGAQKFFVEGIALSGIKG